MANGFYMPVEDLFYITGRGYVFAGKVQSGVLHVGDPVNIESPSYSVTTKVVAIEMIQKALQKADPTNGTVGIMVQKFDAKGVGDGVEHISNHSYRLISLTLTDPSPASKPRRAVERPSTWWQFWKQ